MQGQTSEVRITDLDRSTVELLLRYMYGTLEAMPASMQATVALFKAADKYEVMGLVAECMHIFHRVAQAQDVAPLLQVRVSAARDQVSIHDWEARVRARQAFWVGLISWVACT